jgi:hypothetical protein
MTNSLTQRGDLETDTYIHTEKILCEDEGRQQSVGSPSQGTPKIY